MLQALSKGRHARPFFLSDECQPRCRLARWRCQDGGQCPFYDNTHGGGQCLPLHGAVMKFHQWILEERDKLAARAANPAEGAKVGAALSPPEQKDRRVEGIVIFASSREVVDDVGVRQLGGLASELAKQTAEKAQEQQDVVLKDAQLGRFAMVKPSVLPSASLAEGWKL